MAEQQYTCFDCIHAHVWFGRMSGNKTNYTLMYPQCMAAENQEVIRKKMEEFDNEEDNGEGIKREEEMPKRCGFFFPKPYENCWACKLDIDIPKWEVGKSISQLLCCGNKKCSSSIREVVKQHIKEKVSCITKDN